MVRASLNLSTRVIKSAFIFSSTIVISLIIAISCLVLKNCYLGCPVWAVVHRKSFKYAVLQVILWRRVSVNLIKIYACLILIISPNVLILKLIISLGTVTYAVFA